MYQNVTHTSEAYELRLTRRLGNFCLCLNRVYEVGQTVEMLDSCCLGMCYQSTDGKACLPICCPRYSRLGGLSA